MKFRNVAGLILLAGLLFAPVDTIALVGGLIHHVEALFRTFNLH